MGLQLFRFDLGCTAPVLLACRFSSDIVLLFKFKFQLEELLSIPLLIAFAAYPPVEDVLGYLLLLLLSQAVRRGAI